MMKRPREDRAFVRLLLVSAVLLTAFGALLLPMDHPSMTGIAESRLAEVEAVCDRGTFDLRGGSFPVCDHAVVNGIHYCDKPPLLTFLTMGWYLAVKFLTGVSFASDFSLAVYLVNLPCFLLTCATGFLFAAALRKKLPFAPESWSLFGGLVCVAATPLLSYSVTINNHTPAAFFAMLALFLFEQCEKKGYSIFRSLAAGLAAGALFNCDFLFGGTLGIAGFLLCAGGGGTLSERLRRAGAYASGGIFLLAVEAGLNFLSYGSVLPLYLFSHHPVIAGRNHLLYAFHALFGFEGFFLYTPALLFLFHAFLKGFREKHDRVRTAMLCSVAAAAGIYLFSTSDYGGWCYGFRFFVPFAPVMMYYIFVFWRTWRRGIAFGVFLAALAWGCVTASFGTFNPWTAGYEGSSSKPGTICCSVRNSFLANVLAYTAEKLPDSAAENFLVNRVYGPEVAWAYLAAEFWNRGNAEMYEKAYENYHGRKDGK